MAETPSPPPSLIDRLYLYGIRAVLVVVALVVLGVALIVHGSLVGRLDYIASGAIIILIGIGVGIAAMQTSYSMITKPYFAAEAIVGKVGKAMGPIRAGAKGVVHLEHEQWSSFAEEDIGKGDSVVVTAVEPDKVTLRVRLHRS